MLVSSAVSHGQVVGVVVERMHVQAVLFGSSGELSQQVCDVLLLVDGEVILGGAEEDDAALTDGDGQIAQLFISVWGVKHRLQACGGIFAADDGCGVNVFEVADGVSLLQGLTEELFGCVAVEVRAHRDTNKKVIEYELLCILNCGSISCQY